MSETCILLRQYLPSLSIIRQNDEKFENEVGGL